MLTARNQIPILGTVTLLETSSGAKTKRAPRIPGICGAAVRLNVTRQHLQACLTGRRQGSRRLLAGYARINKTKRD